MGNAGSTGISLCELSARMEDHVCETFHVFGIDDDDDDDCGRRFLNSAHLKKIHEK